MVRAGELERRLRRARFALFEQLIRPLPRPVRVLDVGGTADFWRTCAPHVAHLDLRVTILNRTLEMDLPDGFEAVIGDACKLSEFEPEDHDVVLSSSVIGHVGPFGHQRLMAEEIRRIGRRYFVQTPNHYFPIDWQTCLPGFHFLPERARAWCVQLLPLLRAGRVGSPEAAREWASSIHNLSRGDLRLLFPGATVLAERFMGWTKSFIVHRGFQLLVLHGGMLCGAW